MIWSPMVGMAIYSIMDIQLLFDNSLICRFKFIRKINTRRVVFTNEHTQYYQVFIYSIHDQLLQAVVDQMKRSKVNYLPDPAIQLYTRLPHCHSGPKESKTQAVLARYYRI